MKVKNSTSTPECFVLLSEPLIKKLVGFVDLEFKAVLVYKNYQWVKTGHLDSRTMKDKNSLSTRECFVLLPEPLITKFVGFADLEFGAVLVYNNY